MHFGKVNTLVCHIFKDEFLLFASKCSINTVVCLHFVSFRVQNYYILLKKLRISIQ